MKKFCESLRDYAMEVISFKKKKISLLKKTTKKTQKKSDENAKIWYIWKKNLEINMLKIKIIIKLGTITIIQGNIEMLHLAHIFKL